MTTLAQDFAEALVEAADIDDLGMTYAINYEGERETAIAAVLDELFPADFYEDNDIGTSDETRDRFVRCAKKFCPPAALKKALAEYTDDLIARCEENAIERELLEPGDEEDDEVGE